MPTPSRNVRVDDALWERVAAAAAIRGEDVSTVIRRALTNYAARVERDAARAEAGR